MTAHHRLLSKDRLRCACGWSTPWPAADRWGEIWDAHIRAVESARNAGAPAGAVRPGSPVAPPAPVAYRHTFAPESYHDNPLSTLARGGCACGWRAKYYRHHSLAREDWLEHAIAAYQQEEIAQQERSRADHDALLAINSTFVYDDDEADCDAMAGDDVAGSEVRE